MPIDLTEYADAINNALADGTFCVVATNGAEGIRKLLFALRARETLVQAVPMAFGITLDQFDQDFRSYVISRFGQP